MSMYGEIAAVVLQTGSTVCRAGFSGLESPAVSFPAIVGRPKNATIMNGIEDAKQSYVGHDALAMRGVLSYEYPIERGVITNWDGLATMWEYAMVEQLHTTPENQPVLVADAPGNPTEDRETMAQLFFETFSVPSLYIGYQPVLSLHSAGQTTGVVVSSGGGVTDVSAVYEGYLVPGAHQRLSLGGKDITERLAGLLEKRGATFETQESKAAVDKIKESLTYAAVDYSVECKAAADSFQQKKLYELPDGTTVVLREERFSATEVVFQPALVGLKDTCGVHQLVQKCIEMCDEDFRQEMYANITLAGGNSLFPGFAERLQKEVTLLAPSTVKVNIVAPENRRNSAWVGGSMLASHSSFSSMSVSRAEYEEVGPAAVHSKFI